MSKIELINASCVDQKVDAVVNAANKNLFKIRCIAFGISLI